MGGGTQRIKVGIDHAINMTRVCVVGVFSVHSFSWNPGGPLQAQSIALMMRLEHTAQDKYIPETDGKTEQTDRPRWTSRKREMHREIASPER